MYARKRTIKFNLPLNELYLQSPINAHFRHYLNVLRCATLLSVTFRLFFFDYDLDSNPDILAANGHVEEHIARVQPSIQSAELPLLLHNLVDSKFRAGRLEWRTPAKGWRRDLSEIRTSQRGNRRVNSSNSRTPPRPGGCVD